MLSPKSVAIVAVVSIEISGCAAFGLLFPYDVQEYAPKATWGKSSVFGSCPSFSPAVRVNAKNPDWLRLDIGIWDSEQTKLRKLKDPTLFIAFHQSWHFSIDEQRKREEVPIAITSASPYLDITLADGAQARIRLREFSEGFTYKQGPIYVYLEVPPQDMTVNIPDLRINDELMQLGPVHFTYQKSTRHPC
jgi:hypothetical protein